MKLITTNAIRILVGLLFAVILFHLCIIAKIVPYDIVWGGRLQTDTEMYFFEAISILVNIFLMWILLMKGHHVHYKFPNQMVNLILRVFFALFIINTIGNVFAKTYFEKLFTFLTGFISILLWIILMKRNSEPFSGQ
jgi:hypothetical protein